jgi:NodT family efflux transporter outer membrane factor (OMF) lipoprotein
MKIKIPYNLLLLASISFLFFSCRIPNYIVKTNQQKLPETYKSQNSDTTNLVQIQWRQYFQDKNLENLIDTALKNNQELNIVLQEIEIARNEIRARKGEYLPFATLNGGIGVDKESHFSRMGIVEEEVSLKPNPFRDFNVGFNASWELDVWRKLRNAKDAAKAKYLATQEGKNFLITQLVAEIANSYYELLALDNMLSIVEQNITIQQNALAVIEQEKNSARVSQLAVNRFQAQLLNTVNLQYQLKQQIAETENRLHLLTGVYPRPILRTSTNFITISADSVVKAGVPAQLIRNRPDIRQAEYELIAAKLNIKSAKAAFYPSFRITAAVGTKGFSPELLFDPKALLFSLIGDAIAPLINRNAIKADYFIAHHKEAQVFYQYQQKVLNACLEVLNQLNAIDNYNKSLQTKSKEADILVQSIEIANELLKYARADYIEVLLTQREALNTKMELTEIKLKQLKAKVGLYQALGGGWQ